MCESEKQSQRCRKWDREQSENEKVWRMTMKRWQHQNFLSRWIKQVAWEFAVLSQFRHAGMWIKTKANSLFVNDDKAGDINGKWKFKVSSVNAALLRVGQVNMYNESCRLRRCSTTSSFSSRVEPSQWSGAVWAKMRSWHATCCANRQAETVSN